ncbi:lectin [Pseudoxanthomonas gei]|uniref:lectin n=1 Tax=Pseudoxanthomonas gei TaxID=1383030 RepID=UPI001390D0E5|nr:lectin [Pseudoxanthomonas gei]
MRRSSALLLLALATTSLVACKPATPAADAAAAPEAADSPAPTAPAVAKPAPVATDPVASEPAPADTPAADTQASFSGYGDMKLGSTVEEAKAAWAGELNGKPMEGTTCYYLSPKWVKKPSDFGFMMEEGKFVRYDVGTDKEAAPGGGKVGMTVEALQKLYNNALESSPHKYVQGGSNLSIAASGVAPSKLVFETDAAGKVTAWRVGLTPQVDYVEGCS